MRLRALIALVTVSLVGSMMVGCGTGQEAQQDTRRGNQAQNSEDERTRLEMNTVEGVITRVDVETRRFVLKPRDEDRILIRFNPKSLKPTLDGEEVEPDTMKKGQRAEVRYVIVDDKEIARSVTLQSAE